MEEKLRALECCFAEKIARCEQRGMELRADNREDEAVFEKVRANVYDIFRTVLSAGVRTCGQDADGFRHFFDLRIQQIPTSWQASLEKARAHQDTAKVHLEEIKLAAVAEIRETFDTIWEGAQ